MPRPRPRSPRWARRRGREHRQHRPPHDEADGVELVGGSGEREPRGLAEVARQHRRPAHRIARPVGGPRDRVHEHALERTGAHVAEQHSADEALLPLGRPRRQFAQLAGSLAARPRARQPRRAGRAGRRGRRPRGRGIRRIAHRRRQPAPADADPPLTRLADEESHCRCDLVGLEPAEQVGERVDLRQPRAGRGDGVGGGDEFVEQHGPSLPPASDSGRVPTGASSDVRRSDQRSALTPLRRRVPSQSCRRTAPARAVRTRCGRGRAGSRPGRCPASPSQAAPRCRRVRCRGA